LNYYYTFYRSRSTSGHCTVELGDSAESKFYSIRFTVVASLGEEAIYGLWSALSNVLTKLITVNSSRLLTYLLT